MKRDDLAILGINWSARHDSSAAVVVNGDLIAVGEEERFSRIKHDASYPAMSIKYCLNTAGLTPSDISHVACGWHPWAAAPERLRFLLSSKSLRAFPRKLRFLRFLCTQPYETKRRLRDQFPHAKISFVEHHLAHAASAFYCSPFENAAILTLDGRGEWATGLTAHGEGKKIEKLDEAYFPNSLGLVYEALTHYLGFRTHDEFKVMGLSSYGEPRYLKEVESLFKHSSDGLYSVDTEWLSHPSFSDTSWSQNYFSKEFERRLGRARRPDDIINQRHKDIAASFQRHLENTAVKISSDLASRTKVRNIVMAGGVALNGLMNSSILNHSHFDEFFIQPAANDGGIGLGAALYVYHKEYDQPRSFTMNHAYWGQDIGIVNPSPEMHAMGYRVYECMDPSLVAATLVADNHIVGWFQGRSEIGPRALGNRSILANASVASNKDIINRSIKYRDDYRPLAPSILENKCNMYINGPSVSPYMSVIGSVRDSMISRVPAVVHVDGTARYQTVRREQNVLYYELIAHLDRLTGIPVVLNTSLNTKGRPIVNTLKDALECMSDSDLSCLIAGKWLFCKDAASSSVYGRIESLLR